MGVGGEAEILAAAEKKKQDVSQLSILSLHGDEVCVGPTLVEVFRIRMQTEQEDLKETLPLRKICTVRFGLDTVLASESLDVL